ncbi:PAS domain S-box protein, partial [Chloroflexota bacterium]
MANKTKAQLKQELAEAQQRIAELEHLAAERQQRADTASSSTEQEPLAEVLNREQRREVARFKTMVETSLDGIFTTDLQEPPRLTYANRAAHELFGCDYETQEMVGQMGTDYWPEEDISFLVETLLPQVMASGFRGEVRQKRKDGSIFDASAVVFALRDDTGQPVGLVASIRDITKAKQVEEKLKELEYIANHSPAIFFLWRAAENWPVEFVSDNIEQFGYTPEDFYTGRVPYATTVHPDDLE